MPPKKKTKRSNASEEETYVFVLTRINHNHAANFEPEVMGVYASKDIAARVAGSLDTYELGTFDEALDEYEHNIEGTVIDNRQNPPDSGILLQVGHEDEGEGDHIILEIQKMPLVTKTDLQIKQRKKKNDDDEEEDDDNQRISVFF